MAEHQLPYFNFPVYEEEDDADLIEENKALRDLIPFSVMGSDETVVVDGVRTRCRSYPWGVVYGMPYLSCFLYIKQSHVLEISRQPAP